MAKRVSIGYVVGPRPSAGAYRANGTACQPQSSSHGFNGQHKYELIGTARVVVAFVDSP